MFWAEQCAAIIPCHNEAASLPSVIEGARHCLSNIIVVDDGSVDGTSGIARACGAQIIRFETNRGKGAALQAGFAAARRQGFAYALTLDGDGQHAPFDIPLFFQAAQSGAALVIGRRNLHPAHMPWMRCAVNRLMSAVLSFHTGRSLPDSQCGFRLVHLPSLSSLRWATRRFEFESEMLVACARRGCRIEFVPIQTIYRSERSKIRPLPDTWRWLRWAASHS